MSGWPQLDVRRATRSGFVPATAQLRTWAAAALGARSRGAEIALLVVGRARSRTLNRQYRGRDKATNVLSFPAPAIPPAPAAGRALSARPLGDIVICPEVLRREAREQGKTLRAHWAHLLVHGVLHLVGYDHEADDDARRMERREIAVLRRLGFDNPYRLPARARRSR